MKPKDFQAFAPLVASFSLQRIDAKGIQASKCVLPEARSSLQGKSFTVPARLLWYDGSIVPGLASFEKKLKHWLSEEQHPSADDVILSLLGMAALKASSGTGVVDIISEIQAAIVRPEVSHFFVLPTKFEKESDTLLSLTHEGFCLGLLDSSALKSRCTRAGSDFFDRYGPALTGRFGLQSPIYTRIAINWLPWLAKQPQKDWDSSAYQFVLGYYETLASHHLEMMWHDFAEKQLIYLALGSRILNVRDFSRTLGADRITIYLNLPVGAKRVGYVVPTIRAKLLSLPSPHEKATVLQQLREKYRLQEISESPFHPLLLTVCRSIEQAETFFDEERPDEAFLYSIIALEQIFSERQQTTKAVAARTALIVHRHLGLNYVEAKELVCALYDSRSRFVHDGQSVPAEHLNRITPVVLAVVKALIHLSQPKESHPPNEEQWLKNLDFFVAGFDAAKTFSPEELLESGILPTEAQLQ